jgi:opacity protein-like surface antigen
MKKLLFGTIVTMFTFSSFQANAQMKKGAYVGVNVGYATSSAGATNVLNVQNSSNTTTVDEVEAIKFSFGKGANAGLSFGYMFNENIGAELGIQYLMGGKTKYTNTTTSTFVNSTNNGEVAAKMVQIKPTIVLATSMKNITPYAKIGMVIGSGKITEKNNSTFGTTTPSTSNRKIEYKGGTALGFTAAVGLNFSVSKSLSLSGELNMVNMQYSPKKGTITEYFENGVDKLSTLSVSNKETEYSNKVNDTPTPSTVPSKGTTITMPFGSIGINVGVKYNF